MEDAEIEIKNAVDMMHEIGKKCGNELASLAKKMHPDAILVIPLYRSCIVVAQSEKEKNDGVCSIIAYHDPHWMGLEINEDTMKKFSEKFCVVGYLLKCSVR